MEILDVATGTWTNGPPMTKKRYYYAAVAIEGKIYVMGGYHNGRLSSMEILDMATSTWTAGPPMSTGLAGLCAVLVT